MGTQTAMTRHNITAHDVANVNTRGYREQSPGQSDVLPRGVRISSVSSRPNDSAALSNTDLAFEAGEQIQNKTVVSANVSVARVQNRMVGEVIDLIA